MTVDIHSFDVFEHLSLPFGYGLSVLKFPRSSVFLLFNFFVVHTSCCQVHVQLWRRYNKLYEPYKLYMLYIKFSLSNVITDVLTDCV